MLILKYDIETNIQIAFFALCSCHLIRSFSCYNKETLSVLFHLPCKSYISSFIDAHVYTYIY